MIICTAGHVDHGKTTLLQALTGKHTAHLPEEKKRGLTIDLGYAYLPIENDILGFIDVPGHQKFLSNMLAGLGGLQHAMLIVSAEEGIKPQTDEHLTILKLLNFAHIIVVITKVDRVAAAQISALEAEIKQRYPFLTESTFFATSAQTGEGIDVLKQHLISLNPAGKLLQKPFRYAIDRVFHLKGAGLVVTGTAISGHVRVGDELFLSNGETVRVKGIHAQNCESMQGVAGQRLALNLAGVEKTDIQRGDWLGELAPNFATDRITVQLCAEQRLKENTVAHLYHFATHITGKVNLLTEQADDFAENSANILAEVILDIPLHVAVGDKLIVRSGDDSQTLAGASVIEIHSPKRHKRHELRLNYLQKIGENRPLVEKITHYLADKAVSLPFLAWAEQCYIADLLPLAENCGEKWLFSADFKQAMFARLLEKLGEYHIQHADQVGVTKARLYRIAALDQPESLVYRFIDELIAQGSLAQSRGWLHLPEHKIAFNEQENQLWSEVLPIFQRTNQALWVRDIAMELSVDESVMRNLLYKAGKLGYLVPIVRDRFLTFEQITLFADLIKAVIAKNGAISVNQLRDEIGYGRKVTVQLIEYFDRSGFLRRKGDVHLLRDIETY